MVDPTRAGTFMLYGAHVSSGQPAALSLKQAANVVWFRTTLWRRCALWNSRCRLAAWLLLLCMTGPTAPAQVVSIPDPNLDGAIRNALGIVSGSLSEQDLLGLTNLLAGSRSITNLTGLDYAQNLKTTTLAVNNITDLSALASTWQIQGLFLYRNALYDVSELQGLTNLNCLEVRWNQFTNLSSFALLSSLTSLYLGGNRPADLGPLVQLHNLAFLDLDHANIQDLSPLLPLTNLCALDLSYNPVTNLFLLPSLNGLTNLYLSGLCLTNVSFLAGMNQLRLLTLFSNRVADLTPLHALGKLVSLNLGQNLLTDASLLCGLTNLQYLWLHQNNLTNLGIKLCLPNLRYLNVNGNALTDSFVFDGLPDLQTLDLSGNPLLNANGLSQLYGLTTLNLSGALAQLSSGAIGNLSSLTNLTWLSLAANNLTNLDGLTDLSQLRWLDLRTNLLDLSQSSPVWQAVQVLTNRGTTVLLNPQAHPPTITPAFLPQTIAKLSTWTIPINVSSSCEFTISDDATPAARLQVGVSSSDPLLLPATSLLLSGSGSSRILTVLPISGIGSALITLSVTNAAGLSTNFIFSVKIIVPLPVAFPDPNLEAVVRIAVPQPTGPLSSVDLQNLTSISGFGAGITNLSGLEWCTNLLELNLQGNSLTSLSSIAGLDRLRSVNLAGNKLTDISQLAGLTNLIELYVEQNRLTDVSVVTNLARLGYLDVRLNRLDTVNNPALQIVRARQTIVMDTPQRAPPFIDARTEWVVAAGATSSLAVALVDTGPDDQLFGVGVTTTASQWVPAITPIPGLASNTLWTLSVTTPPSSGTQSNWLIINATNDVGLVNAQYIYVISAPLLPVNGALLRSTGLAWSSSGNAPWFGQTLTTRDGHATGQSGAVGDDQTSRLQADFAGPGRLSFWWKISASVNDELDFSLGALTNQLTGEMDWQRQVFYVPAGPQTAIWRYKKDSSASIGSDAAWLDSVVFEPGSWLEVNGAGTNGAPQLALHGVPGRLYSVEAATNASSLRASASWFRVSPFWIGTQLARQFVDSSAPSGLRVYRLHDSTLWLEPPRRHPDNSLDLVTHDPSGLNFDLQVSTDLVTWTTFTSIINPGLVVTNTDYTTNSTQRFYRVVGHP
jgi:hypothetical protein